MMMQTDKYTKVVLTIIAVCLVIIAGNEIAGVSTAKASGHNVQPVEIVNMLPVPVYVEGGSIEIYGTVETY